MARETETYRATLQSLKEHGLDVLGRNEMLLRPCDVCIILNESKRTVARKRNYYGFVDGYTTYEKLARALSQEPSQRMRSCR